jgi:hypothetical protein
MMRRRSRDILEGELDTERLIAEADVAYEFDFDRFPDLPLEGV